jgi:phosphoglycerate dehydrogenase-like enzyme
VDHDALLAELRAGRISAVLDVTDPEPLPADSPLFTLPNVVLTPHIAGALGTEVRRLGDLAIEELARYAAGWPFAHPLVAADLDRVA